MILRLHLGRWLVLLACWLQAVNLHRTSFQGLGPPYARRAKRAIGVVRRALGGRPGQRLMTTGTRPRESALLNTFGYAPKLRQNRFKYNSLLYLNRGLPGERSLRFKCSATVRFRTCRCFAPNFPSSNSHRARQPVNSQKVLRVFYGPDPQH